MSVLNKHEGCRPSMVALKQRTKVDGLGQSRVTQSGQHIQTASFGIARKVSHSSSFPPPFCIRAACFILYASLERTAYQTTTREVSFEPFLKENTARDTGALAQSG